MLSRERRLGVRGLQKQRALARQLAADVAPAAVQSWVDRGWALPQPDGHKSKVGNAKSTYMIQEELCSSGEKPHQQHATLHSTTAANGLINIFDIKRFKKDLNGF